MPTTSSPVRGPRGPRRDPPTRAARSPSSSIVAARGARRHLLDPDLAHGRAAGRRRAHTLEVPGASAVPVLAPLSLAVLALGGALSIVGLVLRYVFGALTVAIAALLAWLTAQVAFLHPTSAVAAHRHRRDRDHRRGRRRPTSSPGSTRRAWPFVDARRLARAARRRRLHARDRAPLAGGRTTLSHGCRAGIAAGAARPRGVAARTTRIDSWDDLSRGEDPTA